MKRLTALILALALLAGCGPAVPEGGEVVTHILCTTYPVYLFTTAVTHGAEGVEVELLVDQQTSCLHDYTLTVSDMKAIDRADIIVINGAGMEDFMSDALEQKDVPVIDCSKSAGLLPAPDHHHHNGEDEDDHEVDPHYWMDPRYACYALLTLTAQLSQLHPEHEDIFKANLSAALAQMEDSPDISAVIQAGPLSALSASNRLITFHDGFQYFASAFGLKLLRSIEEEEGSEASAKELEEVIGLVRKYHIPAIFVEKNGSCRSADVIARETGCQVYELDLIMSGEGVGIEPYIQAVEQNLSTIKEALG